MEAYYVYMLRCRGGSLYTGMTNDVARRMAMHWAEGNACRRAGEDRGVVPRASRRGGNDAARGAGIFNFCKSNVSTVTGNDKIGLFSQNALDKPEILAIMKLSAEVPLLLRFNED